MQACSMFRGQKATGRDEDRQATTVDDPVGGRHLVPHLQSTRGLNADSINSINFAYAFALMTLGLFGVWGFGVLDRGPALKLLN